jgi:branched-chain amino acid transport system substrate-binding protein
MRSLGRYLGSIAVSLALLSPTANAQELLLGYFQTSAGPFASLSKTTELAAQIAVDEVNSAGGIGGKRLRLVPFETAGKPDQAAVGLRKLAEDDKVLAIVGPFSSGECRVVFPAGERTGIVTVSMASSAPKLAEPFTYALRNTSDEGLLFSRLLKTLKERKFDMKTSSIAYATDDVISKTMGEIVMPNLLKQNGVEIKGVATFQTQAFDLAPQVSSLAADPADLVAIGAGPDSAVRLAQELRRQGNKGRIIGGSTISDSELAKRIGPAGDGTLFPTTFYPDLNERTKAFSSELVRRAKAIGVERSAASQFDAQTYSIVMMYAQAMKDARVTGEPSRLAAERTAIRDGLRALKNFPALEGDITFQKNGDALKPAYIIQIEGGAFKLVQSHPAE